MPRPEILDRSPVSILLDDGGADVGRTCNGRRVSEPLADLAHYLGNASLRLRLGFGRAVLGELDRSRQRSTPRPEILGRELRAQVGADIAVQPALVEIAVAAVVLELEEPRAGLRK